MGPFQTITGPLLGPNQTIIPKHDERTAEQRRADALASRSLNTGLPETGGVRPHVTVVVDLPTLLGQLGAPPAHLDRLGAISAQTARRLACDAAVTTLT